MIQRFIFISYYMYKLVIDASKRLATERLHKLFTRIAHIYTNTKSL